MKTKTKIIMILVIDTVLLIACIPSIISISEKAALPFQFDSNLLVIEDFNNGYNIVSAGWKVETINGIVLSDTKSVEFICDGLPIGASVVVQFDNAGKKETVILDLSEYYQISAVLINIFVMIIFVSLGIFVLYKKRGDFAAIMLHHVLISAAMIIIMTYGGYYLFGFHLVVFIRGLHLLAYAFMPVFFLHFTFVFPENKSAKYKPLFFAAYVIAGIIASVLIVSHGIALNSGSCVDYSFFMLHERAAMIWFAAVSIAGIGNFIYTYKKSTEFSVRQKILWVITGTAIGLLSYILLFMLPRLFRIPPVLSESLMVLMTSVAPISLTISIVRYQLFNIDRIINRSAVYFIFIISLSAIYAGLVAGITYLIGDYAIQSSKAPYILATVVVAVIFQPVKLRIQGLIDKKFFKVSYNYRAAQQKYLESIKNCYSIESIADSTVQTAYELIPVERILFVLVNTENMKFDVLTEKIISNYQEVGKEFFDSLAKLDLSDALIALPNVIEDETEYQTDNFDSFNKAGVSAIFLSKRSEIHLNLLLVGKKRSGFRFTSEDITTLRTMNIQAGLEIKRVELQNELVLKQAEADKLAELNRLKSYFVSSVSHELKTPLTSIRLFAEIMQIQKNIPEEKTIEYLQIIQSECDRLNRLINNVLDFSKIERGIKEYRFSDVELNDIVNSAITSFKNQLKFLKFELDIYLANKELRINADPDAVFEALVNLLSNAMKYSISNKHITITTFENEKMIGVSIADEGAGIDEEDLKHLFEAFYRAKNTNIKTVKGTGLGLTLVSHIMEAHKGYIDVKSELNKGSVFTMYFPKLVSLG